MLLRRLTLILAFWCLPALASPSLEQIMEHPDWIGPPVEQSWLSLDGQHAYYRVKRADSPLRDLRRIDLDSGRDEVVADDVRTATDAGSPVFDAQRRRALFVRDGDLFLRELASGQVRQLTAGPEPVSDPRFTVDGNVLVNAGRTWLQIDADTRLVRPLTDLRFEDAPDTLPKDNTLPEVQLRLFDTLQRLREERAQTRDHELALSQTGDSRRPAPWYLGKGQRAVGTDPSPDRRWLLLATETVKERSDNDLVSQMPNYVTESGYTEVETVRSRVGQPVPTGQALELLDLAGRERIALDLTGLPGIDDDPLADLRDREGAPKAPEIRPVTLLGSRWSDDGRFLAIQLRSVDNKDRWLVTVEPRRSSELRVVERLTDPAWIGWSFNDLGWLPGQHRLWFLSEASGYSHLYLADVGRPASSPRALTGGRWEVHTPQLARDGQGFWFVGNANHPTEYELYRVPVGGGRIQAMTSIRGVESFALGVDDNRVLVTHSEPYIPAQLSLLDSGDRQLRRLTDTRSAEYRAVEWPALEIVGVPSSHQEQPLWSKLYRPAELEPGKRYPAVLFVHGAGYLQNSHWRYPQYFREQMFHNLLVERGFIVLDIDYRASAGYGRDWRTAIYRQMGHPELEDLIDGIDWLVAEQQVDPERIGVYGGSYGGFMALMALFREPDRFLAGAALRPVTDWRHYNHGYTSNILNTPELDPEAHRISSPIEYAENLRGHLLIAHGMLDDNVFYQDVVMLTQRLIELRKDNWELASYPLEAHGYIHPESWFDQYRRILKLFERTLLD